LAATKEKHPEINMRTRRAQTFTLNILALKDRPDAPVWEIVDSPLQRLLC